MCPHNHGETMMIPGFDLYTYLATSHQANRDDVKESIYRSAYRGAPVTALDRAIDVALTWIDQLHTIRVLYRRPVTLMLYGIPYELRPGQAPRDIWDGPMYNPDHPLRKTVAPTHQKYAPPMEWIWLEALPSWTTDRQAIANAWLVAHKDEIPENPHEWCRVGTVASCAGVGIRR